MPTDVVTPARAVPRIVAAAAAALALTVSACAGSSTTGGAGSVVAGTSASASAPSSATTTDTASAPASASGPTSFPSGPSTPAATGVAGTVRACADYAAIAKASDEASGKTIGAARAFAAQLVVLVGALAADAPAEIHEPAQQLLSAVKVIKYYADRATSLQQLRAERDSTPPLKAANDTLGTAGDKIETWRKVNCG